MKKIDLNFKLKDYKDVELPDSAKDYAASIMLNHKTTDKVKFFDWAMTLGRGGVIEVDDSDFDKIKEALKTTELYNNLVAGALIKHLDSIKEMNKTKS